MKPLPPPLPPPARPPFTLIEMVSVLGIVLLLISILVAGVRFAFYFASDQKSRATFKQLEIAFDQYYADNRYYPSLPDIDPRGYGAVTISNSYKTRGYVPLGVEITQKEVDSIDPATDTATSSWVGATITVPWFYYTHTGQNYYRDSSTGVITVAGTEGNYSTTSSFFRATLNRSPDNYTPYIEDVINPANIDNYTKDGFGHNIYYRSPGLINSSAYDLWSAGADGFMGAHTDQLNPDDFLRESVISSKNDAVLHVYGPTGTNTPLIHLPGGDPDDYTNWRK